MSETVTTSPRRAADWYELFFDLVFVAVIALSAHLIEVDPSPGTVVLFVALFFPLWWAWVNLMVTNNLFGPQFPGVAVLVIVAMPGPAAMAVAISGGIAEFGWLYALGAAWIRLTLLAMWLLPITANRSPVSPWRTLSYNLGTAVIWLVSIAVPSPYRYALWVLAVGIEVFLLAQRRGGFADELYERASVSHLLERVGLFVVIVIGEAVYLSVTALAANPSIGGAVAALFGLALCAFLARGFFRWGAPTAEVGLTAAQRNHSYGAMRDVAMYLPFLLVTALTLVAAAIGSAVDHAEQPLEYQARTLLAVGVGGFYFANALVGMRLGRSIRLILLLLAPGIALPVLACVLSGGLAAWATLGLTALTVMVLDVVSKLLGAKAAAMAARASAAAPAPREEPDATITSLEP